MFFSQNEEFLSNRDITKSAFSQNAIISSGRYFEIRHLENDNSDPSPIFLLHFPKDGVKLYIKGKYG